MWRLRSGAPWRDLPERYGPSQTCYERFRRWQQGRWQQDGYDKRAANYRAGVVLAALVLWLPT